MQIDLNELPIGIEIKTTKGFVWKLVAKDTWLDVTSGLTWLPVEDGKYNHYEAEKLQTEDKRLPTADECRAIEEHGFRDILLDMRGRWFWSSSVRPGNPCVALGLYGVYGYVNVVFRDFNDGSVRPVREK
jgi:hypothetical protein